jgi:branched-chain amino acid transport system substrate-binding protein
VGEEYGKRSGGKALDTNSGYAYEAIAVLADVLERAKSTDPEAIVDAIKKTHYTEPIMVSAGPVRFNEIGDNIGASCAMIQILKGRAAVVHPKEVAEEKLVFPAPKFWERA